MEKEVRLLQTEFELRETDDGKEVIEGYAALFDDPADEQMGFIEKIAAGAFSKAIKNTDTRALINHNPGKVLGRKSSGTLRLIEDDKGLYYEVDPPNTTYANDLIESMKRGDIDQSSFAFIVSKEEWDESGDIPVRTILEVEELHDVSPVTFPWYENTESGLKTKSKVLAEHRSKKQAEKDSLENIKEQIKLRERVFINEIS